MIKNEWYSKEIKSYKGIWIDQKRIEGYLWSKKTKIYYKVRKRKVPGIFFCHAGLYIPENIALKIIKSCRKPAAVDFRSNLGIDQTHMVRMCKEQSVSSAIISFLSKIKNNAVIQTFKL